MTLCFIDTETTGLDRERHQVWEIAAIVRTEHGDDEYHWMIRPDMTTASPDGLRIGRYYSRIGPLLARPPATARRLAPTPTRVDNEKYAAVAVAAELSPLLDGATVVGAVPDFDAEILRRWLRAHDQADAWHYHLVDVETLAVGYIHGLVRQASEQLEASGLPYENLAEVARQFPWDSEVLSRAVGVEPPTADQRHTALGDARWVRDLYDAITSGKVAG